jgi:hypothetical protein
MEKGIRPFYCGSQDADWTSLNCNECKKAEFEDYEKMTCEIQKALEDAWADDGLVAPDILKRMGYANSDVYRWLCPEKEVE